MMAVFRRCGHRVEKHLVDGAYELQILFGEPPAAALRPAAAD